MQVPAHVKPFLCFRVHHIYITKDISIYVIMAYHMLQVMASAYETTVPTDICNNNNDHYHQNEIISNHIRLPLPRSTISISNMQIGLYRKAIEHFNLLNIVTTCNGYCDVHHILVISDDL